MTSDSPGPKSSPPRGIEQTTSLALAAAVPFRANLDEYATGLAVLAIPLLWRTPGRRPLLFATISLLVTWLLMFLTTGAGGSAHHVLLLWPFHFMLIAIAAAQLKQRWIMISVAALLCCFNLAVINQYFADLIRNGTPVRWTDAFSPLVTNLEASNASYIFVADWGITETVNLLTEGRVPISGIDEKSIVPALFLQPNALFVTHGPPFLQTPKLTAALFNAAGGYGFEKEPVATIYDRNGRGIFEVFRFRRNGN